MIRHMQMLAAMPLLALFATTQVAAQTIDEWRMIMRRYTLRPALIALLYSLLMHAAHAQTLGTISGRAVDWNMMPQQGGIVRLNGTTVEVRWQADGRFSITGVQPGECDVQIIHAGFLPYRAWLGVAVNGINRLNVKLSTKARGVCCQANSFRTDQVATIHTINGYDLENSGRPITSSWAYHSNAADAERHRESSHGNDALHDTSRLVNMSDTNAPTQPKTDPTMPAGLVEVIDSSVQTSGFGPEYGNILCGCCCSCECMYGHLPEPNTADKPDPSRETAQPPAAKPMPGGDVPLLE